MLTNNHLKAFTIFLSAIISILIAWIINLQTASINPDGILYLMTAMKLTSVSSAFNLFSWPFYSLFVFHLHQLTGMSFFHASFILNVILQALTVVFFLLIIREITSSLKLLVIAAVLILTYPQFNGYRDYIIRDFGYWAFFLCGIWGLIRYVNKPNVINAIIFYLGFIVGFLFRVEAICFLALLPFSCLILNYSYFKRLKLFLALLFPACVIFLVLVIYFYFVRHESMFSIGRMPQLTNIVEHGYVKFIGGYNYLVTALQHKVFGPDAQHSAHLIALWGLLGYWLNKLILGIGLIYWGFLGYVEIKFSQAIPTNTKRVLFFAILIYFSLTLYFIFTRYFLVDRYILAMGFLILLWSPFALMGLYQRWKQREDRFLMTLLLSLILLWLAFFAVGGIIKFGPSKFYINDGARWLAQHAVQPMRVCTNSKYLLFKVKGHNANFIKDFGFTVDKMKKLTAFECDYYAIAINRKHPNEMQMLQKIMGEKPIKTLRNKRGDTLFIYKIKKDD